MWHYFTYTYRCCNSSTYKQIFQIVFENNWSDEIISYRMIMGTLKYLQNKTITGTCFEKDKGRLHKKNNKRLHTLRKLHKVHNDSPIQK